MKETKTDSMGSSWTKRFRATRHVTNAVNEIEAREEILKLMIKVQHLITEDDLFYDMEVVQDVICGRIKVKKAAMVIVDRYFRRKKKAEIARKEDPGKFVIPVEIGGVRFKGLCDLESNICIMPEDTFGSVSIGKMDKKKSTLVMAKGSSTESGGFIRDVTVQTGKYKFLTDFILE